MKFRNSIVLSFRTSSSLNMLTESHHFIMYSSNPYYLFKLHYVTKDFLKSHGAITTLSLIAGYCTILHINPRVQLCACEPPIIHRRRQAH